MHSGVNLFNFGKIPLARPISKVGTYHQLEIIIFREQPLVVANYDIPIIGCQILNSTLTNIGTLMGDRCLNWLPSVECGQALNPPVTY